MSQEEQDRTRQSGGSEPHEHSQPQQPTPEVHREREVIVTNSGGQRSGLSTLIMVIFASVALVVIVLLAFTFLQRDDDGILPDELDINIEVPQIPGSTEGS